MKTEATWSGSQAARATDALKHCLVNKMVVDFFDDTEKEALQLLLARAEAGYALSFNKPR